MGSEKQVLKQLCELFPGFAAAKRKQWRPLEQLLPPASAAEIQALEARLGLLLPQSYKTFLAITRGFWLGAGGVQFSATHPFLHD